MFDFPDMPPKRRTCCAAWPLPNHIPPPKQLPAAPPPPRVRCHHHCPPRALQRQLTTPSLDQTLVPRPSHHINTTNWLFTHARTQRINLRHRGDFPLRPKRKPHSSTPLSLNHSPPWHQKLPRPTPRPPRPSPSRPPRRPTRPSRRTTSLKTFL